MSLLVDCVESGHSVDDLVAGYPTVAREQVIAFLSVARTALISRTERTAETTTWEESMGANGVFDSNPNIMSGAPVFVGTRVPVRNLLD